MNEKKIEKVILIGAGGHGKIVLEAALLLPNLKIVGVLDNDETLWGSRLLGIEILGGDERLPDLIAGGITSCVIGIGGAGDNSLRTRVYERSLEAGLKIRTLAHPGATVSQWAEIGDGCFLACGSRVMAGSRIGPNTIINTGASIDHDCHIGANSHIAPGATLCGNVEVGESSHVGAGAVVKQNVKIGRNVVVGAGAAVIRDLPDHVVAVGCPAKEIRKNP